MKSTFTFLLTALALSGCATTFTQPSAEARAALNPAGTLRAGILLTTALQVTKDASGELKGVAIDLSKELARRMGVAFVPVGYNSIELLMEGGKTAQWDIAFLALESSREKDLDYAAPFMEVEVGYLAPAGSSLMAMTDIDKPGVRVAVTNMGGPDHLLSRLFKNAALVRVAGVPALIEALQTGKADIAAANKPTLFVESARLPGSRVLDGRVASVQYAIATRKGQNAAGKAYVRNFVDAVRAEGIIKTSIDNAGLRGVVVAAPQ